MDKNETNSIVLMVSDEKSLYDPFSPENEFSDKVKLYIRSKVSAPDGRSGIDLKVVSSSPIDEDRFRSAVASWLRDEKLLFSQELRTIRRMLIGMLAIATAFIFLSIAMETRVIVLKYTIIPVLGSVALGRAALISITELPINRAKRQILEKVEQSSTIEFEVKDTPPKQSA